MNLLCDECGKNPANIRLISVVAGQKVERNLCSQCAAKHNLRVQAVDVSQLLSMLLLGGGERAGNVAAQANAACAACGTKLSQVIRTRQVGCPACYENFRSQLCVLLKKQQGADAHIGRRPKPPEETDEDAVEALRQELAIAVACGDFEQAASLRDEIRARTDAQQRRAGHD